MDYVQWVFAVYRTFVRKVASWSFQNIGETKRAACIKDNRCSFFPQGASPSSCDGVLHGVDGRVSFQLWHWVKSVLFFSGHQLIGQHQLVDLIALPIQQWWGFRKIYKLLCNVAKYPLRFDNFLEQRLSDKLQNRINLIPNDFVDKILLPRHILIIFENQLILLVSCLFICPTIRNFPAKFGQSVLILSIFILVIHHETILFEGWYESSGQVDHYLPAEL